MPILLTVYTLYDSLYDEFEVALYREMRKVNLVFYLAWLIEIGFLKIIIFKNSISLRIP